MLGDPGVDARRTSGSVVIAVLLAIAAFPLLRPSTLGERFTLAGLVLAIAAGFILLAHDRGHATWLRSGAIVIVLIGLAQLWAAFRAPYNGVSVAATITGTITTLAVLAIFAFLFADDGRTRMFLRPLLLGMAILCASSIVTVVLAGSGIRIELFAFPITSEVAATVYFPFTITSGAQSVFGMEIPRFTGLGREPGWMAMYAAVAWLIWPRLFGPVFRFWRLMLLGGVFTSLSTAGFGIFVVVVTFDLFLRPRPGAGLISGYLRQVTGLVVLVLAVWLALAAPVLGLEAKTVQNVTSLSERNAATLDGLRALENLSLGEESTSRIPGVNLVAAIAEVGWPYSLMMALALLLPLAVTTNRRLAVAPIGVIFLTLLLAQPPGDSTTVFVLAMGVFALANAGDPGSAAADPEAKATLAMRRS